MLYTKSWLEAGRIVFLRMKPAALLAQRMHGLRLHDRARCESALETVRWMGALQAQDYESGLWAIGARTQSATRAEVEAAIARREIVRTWPMRGTWHFVPAVDARWMQELLAIRMLPAIRKRSADFGFDEATVSRCRGAVVNALEGGRSLPRQGLVRRIAQAGFRVEDQAGTHLLRRFGNEGLLCNGVMAGKEPTFALRDEWVERPAKLDREAGLAEIALRYFRSHGPATVQDFVWWTGLTVRDARLGIASVGRGLSRHVIDGRAHWVAGEDEPPPVSGVELLPAFDEHLLGYQDRGAMLDEERAESVCPGGNGVFRSTLVAKGRVAGLWRKKEMAKRLMIEVTAYQPLSPTARRDTEKAAPRVGAFYGKPVTLRFS